MHQLKQALGQGAFLLDLDARSMEEILEHAMGHLARREILSEETRVAATKAVLEREALDSTAMGHGLAIPHAYLDTIEEPVLLFIRLAKGLNLDAPDGVPVRFLFILLGPVSGTQAHLETLMMISRLMADESFRYDIRQAQNGDELLDALGAFHLRHSPAAVPEAKEPVDDGFNRTGRLFGGIIQDLKRRLPHYGVDIKDGLNAKAISSILFLFFACIAPAVTFGGVMSIQTGGNIGAVEMLVATAACGVAYALLSGTPLIILGGTGPLLIITALLYELTQSMGLPFLATYAWVGLWSALFLFILAATDASFLMRYFTRFTDEIFAALISVIFVYEAVKALYNIFMDQEVREDTALLSLVLALGTYFIASKLRDVRRSNYLMGKLREFFADFGPIIALAIMTTIAILYHEVDLHVLAVPDSFGTTSGRPWMVELFALPPWVMLGSAVPAVLVAVLVFLDQNITGRIVNSPDHKLERGVSYHYDLAIVGGLIAACSLFGLPWLVAATVRSLNHLRSLATVEEVVVAGGQNKEQILHVRENRITGMTIHVLIGASLLALPLLKEIPMAVLYGLFLYMGIVSMAGNQFFERLSLWIMDPNLYPATHYTRRVPMGVIHRFTLIQLLCLGGLWAVKVSRLGIVFPVFIAALVPLRIWMGRFFTEEELESLDAEETPDENQDRGAD